LTITFAPGTLGGGLACPTCRKQVELDAKACAECGREFWGPYRFAELCTTCRGRGGEESTDPIFQRTSALTLCRNCLGQGRFLYDGAVPMQPCSSCHGLGEKRAWWSLRQLARWLVLVALVAGLYWLPQAIGNTAVANLGVTIPIVLIALTAFLLRLHAPALRVCSKCQGRGGTL
jgi:hypothetical protein